MKIAIVHDWITGMRGGEWCLEAFLLLYPSADVFTLVHIPGVTTQNIDNHVHKVSWLSKIPGIKKFYRGLLPLYPLAIRQFDFSGYDCVITISHAAAKNIKVPPGVRHISYCLTPMRYIWDQAAQYLKQFLPLAWPLIKVLRAWDVHGSRSVTEFVAISRFIAARIRKFYGRKSVVVYSPVAVEWIAKPRPRPYPEPYFLFAGALVPYKRAELAVEACTRAGIRLVVAGGGAQRTTLEQLAGPTVTLEGRVTDERLAALYQHCQAFLFLAEEDFGIMPIECLAAGRPVIARHVGASRETIRGIKPWLSTQTSDGGNCGIFMEKAPVGTPSERDALIKALRAVESGTVTCTPEAARSQASLFSPAAFYKGWTEAVGPGLSTTLDESSFVAAFEKARSTLHC